MIDFSNFRSQTSREIYVIYFFRTVRELNFVTQRASRAESLRERARSKISPPLPEPIRFQDLENSARSQAKKKIISLTFHTEQETRLHVENYDLLMIMIKHKQHLFLKLSATVMFMFLRCAIYHNNVSKL